MALVQPQSYTFKGFLHNSCRENFGQGDSLSILGAKHNIKGNAIATMGLEKAGDTRILLCPIGAHSNDIGLSKKACKMRPILELKLKHAVALSPS
jgi:hypothetical protein